MNKTKKNLELHNSL